MNDQTAPRDRTMTLREAIEELEGEVDDRHPNPTLARAAEMVLGELERRPTLEHAEWLAERLSNAQVALRVALDGLESAGCQFSACEGPTLEPIDMVTCRTCIAIAKVRAELGVNTSDGR